MQNFIATLRTLLMTEKKIDELCSTLTYDELIDLHDQKIINIQSEKFMSVMSKYY